MNRRNLKRLIILSIPYVVLGLVATNLGEAWRIAKENIPASPHSRPNGGASCRVY